MKKIKKLLNKLNNNGSSMVMVIVGLAFIGIIVGALLTAVGYSYRLKLQDLNSRDNFYYVEQAMNEIYAGVGSETVKSMQEAYSYTVENMVYYDFNTKSYVTKSKEEIQQGFEEQFMLNVQSNALFNEANLANTLASYITNDSVKLDSSKLAIDIEKDDTGKTTKITIKNVILTRTQQYDKNVASGAYTQTLSTDIEIGEPDFDVLFNATNDNYANIFKYSMVADMGVEVTQPTTPLVIAGNIYAASDYYNKKYNESMYKQGVSDTSKKFETDDSAYTETVVDENGVSKSVSKNVEYTHGAVTSKGINDSNIIANTLYNEYMATKNNVSVTAINGDPYYYNGENERSMYSGFYVDGSNVTVMADMVIVPGSIAVMNKGTFSLYNKNGTITDNSELWADNIVLDGSSDRTTAEDGTMTYEGSSIVIKANAFIKDDTEINSAGSNFTLSGSYYGFGDSTEKDARDFIPTVDKENFLILAYQQNTNGTYVTDASGNYVPLASPTDYRGHYNSSAIIINGNQSTLDLEFAMTIYLAGRSYIELSKDVTETEVIDTTNKNEATVSNTYVFDPHPTDAKNDTDFVRDYKTGESISVKSSQLAYIPVKAAGTPEPVYSEDKKTILYYNVELIDGLKGASGAGEPTLFQRYFPSTIFNVVTDTGRVKPVVPCMKKVVSGKEYYYLDFEAAYNKIINSNDYNFALLFRKDDKHYPDRKDTFAAQFPSAQYYASSFIVDYANALSITDENKAEKRNVIDATLQPYLTDIGDFETIGFEPGDITYSEDPNQIIYSSGAITTKEGSEFNIVQGDSWDTTTLNNLFSSNNTLTDENYVNTYEIDTTLQPTDYSVYGGAYKLSNVLEQKYNLVKWNLGHYDLSSTDVSEVNKNRAEIKYIDALVADANFGEASITPINKFINMDKIVESTSITPAMNSGDKGDNVLDLASGYDVWVSYDDVTIKAKDANNDGVADNNGIVRGMVITKGDVYFDPNVTSFEGLIVSGGKVYVAGNVTNMYASPAICQAILRECYLTDQKAAKYLLNLFKGYELDEDGTSAGVASPTDPLASSTDSSTEAKTIDSIDYSDVCRFSNWMKNVE
ncbi:MAG: hypothetical protein IKJ73_04910 [Lachnospiraceae bacterium]|nr:hypothetical protein [Lachnospiraceae bacterium]